jgi:hypothetical protein
MKTMSQAFKLINNTMTVFDEHENFQTAKGGCKYPKMLHGALKSRLNIANSGFHHEVSSLQPPFYPYLQL